MVLVCPGGKNIGSVEHVREPALDTSATPKHESTNVNNEPVNLINKRDDSPSSDKTVHSTLKTTLSVISLGSFYL